MQYYDTRSSYPVGTKVQFIDSGQKAEVVSVEESDEDNYESETDVFLRMNGQIIHSDVSRIERR